MRFTRFGRYEFNDTPRKRAAYARKLQAEQGAMPLFADPGGWSCLAGVGVNRVW